MQMDAPPPVIETAPVQAQAEFVVVSRDIRNQLVASADTPLPLIKGARTEDALLRQAIFVTSTLSVTRSIAPPNLETLRWTYEPFLQHQLCFTSMTGQFACTVAEVTALPDKSSGEAPNTPAPADAAAPPTSAAAEAVHAALVQSLRTRGAALFGDGRRLRLDPMLKAAGVSVRTTAATGATRR
jgi:hypothetical protein